MWFYLQFTVFKIVLIMSFTVQMTSIFYSCIPGFWILLASFVLFIYYLVPKRDARVQHYMKKLQGPISPPLVGVSYMFVCPNHKLAELMLSFTRRYKSLMAGFIGSQAYVIIHQASLVEKILSSSAHIEKSTDYNYLQRWLGLGLLTAKPKQWHARRKLLTPSFHFKILEEFHPIFNEQANILVDILKKDRANTGEKFNIFPYITKCALDIICETAMGKKLNAQSGSGQDYVDVVTGYGEILVRKMLRPWEQIEWLWKLIGMESVENQYVSQLHAFTEKVIADKQKERKNAAAKATETVFINTDDCGMKKRKAFLDLLLDAAETDCSLTNVAIREETDTFMFEGHDTTSANMVWTVLLLASHPEHQKRVQEELDEIFGGDIKRNVTSSDISKMKYLECCVKESLRIYPSVPIFMRYLTEDLDLGDGQIVPRKANVVINSAGLHRDPEVFPDPEVFIPERFTAENSVGRHPFAYIPFSAGPRNCIGQKFALLEEKTVLAKLLLNFNIEAVGKREDVRMVPDIILRPLDGIFVKLTSRK